MNYQAIVLIFPVLFILSCSHQNDSTQSLEKNAPETTYAVQTLKVFEGKKEVTRFELRRGEGWKGSRGSFTHRSELSSGIHTAMNSIQNYRCSLFIPKDFPIEDNRLVLLQWWPKTKRELGEEGRSPALAVRFVNGEMYITVRYSDIRVIKNPDAVPKKTLFSLSKDIVGRWHDFEFKVKWSYKNDGFVQAFLNNKSIINYKGPVGYNDDVAPVFRYGLYRDDSPQTYVAYFSGCREE